MVDVCKRGHSKILVKKQPEGCFLWDKVQHATGESALQIIIGPQGTSIGRRSPRVSRIPIKVDNFFPIFLKKNPRKCNKIQEHFLNVGKIQISFFTTAIRAAAISRMRGCP